MNTVYAIRRAGSARMTPMASALALTLFSGLAVSVTPPMMDGPGILPSSAAGSLLMDSPASVGTSLYTIVFKQAPVATYAGDIAGYARPQRLLQGSSVGKLDIQASTTVAYTNYLQNRQDVFVADIGAGFGRSIDVRARMQHALNAVIVELTSSEAAAVNQRPDVEFVEREHQLELHTDNSGGFIGAPSIYNGFTASGAGSKGEGIVIGDIDTGINWQSPAFAAVGPVDGYVHINPRGTGNYLGLCQAGQTDAGRCNDKLIGMYNFASTLPTRSGEDTQGHGSHTASTAGGNVWNATFASGPFTVSGIAPHANIIAYLACPSTCPSTATSQSANQAVIDGVDVINFSISGGTSPWTDATSTAFRNANAAGVFVAASAGNTSATVTNPVGQVNHLEPWVETVAASTQNRMIGVALDLDGGPANTQDIPLRTGAAPLPTAGINAAPIIKSPNFADGSNDGCAAYPANYFTRPFAQPAEYIFANGFDDVAPPTTTGGIAVLRLGSPSNCASGVRRAAALAAGAIGVIFVDTNYINLGAADTSWSMLLSDWNILEAAYNPTTATVSIDITARTFPAVGDRVADFSFRGPRLVSGQGIIKPDITGPGVDILAVGAANIVGVNGVYLSNGTSMSSPHMAGSAALMRGINPSWTPPQIKSAMNMSSNNFGSVNQDGSPVTLWDYGSGRVNLTAAAKVGLIMDETPANFLAANPATGGDVSTLNLANISKYNIVGTQVFTRTFRRARAGSQTYTLSVVGLPPAAVSVSPASFFINSSGSATVTVTVNSALLTEAQWTLGELLVTPAAGDEPNLHLPIAVYPGGPQIAVSPPALSGSSDTTVSNNLTITNTANPTLNWMFQTTGTAVVTPFNAPVTTNGQLAGYYVGLSQGYHWSQNFDIAATTRITTLRANGFTLPSTTSLTATNTPQVIFSVYADNAGSPAGAPEGFGSAPLWTHSATISTANGITTTGGAISLNLNAANVVGNPLNLPPGRYWMTVSPRINGTAQQTAANPLWAWYVSDGTPVGNVPKMYAPWSDPLAFQPPASGLNMLAGFVQGTVSCALPSWVNLTTTSGALGAGASQAVPVVFNAAGLTAGVYSGALCVTSNATNASVVSVPLTFTVPNGGSLAPTVSKAFSPGSVAANVDSTLTISLSNSNSTAATLTSALTDTFPSGLVVSPTPAASTTCPSGTVTATAGSGSVSLAAGAQIPAGVSCGVGEGTSCTPGVCTVSVNVRSATPSSYANTIAAGALVTSNGSSAAAANATLVVTAAPVTYTVTPSVSGGNGSIAPSTPVTVNSGATPAFTLTPDAGFVIGPVTGTCGGTLSGNMYTTAAVAMDCTVIASFTAPPACTTAQAIEAKATAGTAGPTGYTTLKGAFDAINDGTHQGVVDLSVCGDTTETASAVLNASGVGAAAYTAATIKPAGGAARTITGDLATPLVDLNGADNVTIDGLDTGGNALTISNASISSTAGTSTIRFISGATGNTVSRTSLLGSSTTTLATVGGGTVYFATDAVTTDGNDNNTIANSNIGPAGTNLPNKAVFGLGTNTTLANGNSGVVISNNNIYDFFNAASSVSGIYVANGNDTWTMSGNRVYQTAARTFTAATPRYAGITLSQATTPRGSFNVVNNVIGFGAANGTGTTTIDGTGTEFRGIDAPNVDTVVATSIQGNTISGINQTTNRTSTTSGSSAFVGVLLGTSNGRFDVGGTTGNAIGSLNGSSTIVINGLATAATAQVIGIYDFSFESATIANNSIGSITIQGAGTTLGFRGILVSGSASTTTTVTGNTIANITDTQVGNNILYGISLSGSVANVTGNTIRNFTGNGNGATVVMQGIGVSVGSTAAPNTVARNTVHSLSNTVVGGASGAIYAIDVTFPAQANILERNRVHSIAVDTTFVGYQVNGIIVRGGTTAATGANSTVAVRNNMIRLGFNAAGATITAPLAFTGIRDTAGSAVANQYYHNSVYVGGSGVVGGTIGTVGSYALNSDTVTTARNFQNNIFWNARSNAAPGAFHVGIRYGGTAANPPGLTSNYNNIRATGTDGFTGLFNGFVYPTLPDFQAASGLDANSFAGDPQFIAPTGDAATGNLHISATNPTPIEASGTLVASVTDDYDGEVRSGLSPVDVGADAGNFVAVTATTYTVTPSVGTGSGTIAPAVAQTVNSGATTSFTLTPASGFAIGTITGTCGGSLSGSVYTTNAVNGNCTVVANFTQITYQVTPSVGTGSGTIAPAVAQTVNSGATTSFTLTPASGFAIGTTTGTCGGSLSGSVYTTNAVSGNCTVVANFTQITYQVTPSVGTGSGTIAPAVAQTVNSGATTSFTLTPASGFAIGSTTGTCGGSLSGSVYTTNAVSGNCTVVANFTQITYQVTPSVSGGNGSISPATAQTVNSGATSTFTLTPDSGYASGPVSGTCGGTLTGNSYTTNAVTGACTVIASFTQLQCTTTQPIEVKATGGTTGPTGYTTLKGAFDAINSGTHTGVLEVAVCGDTTETASAVLNADAVGSASYSAATIKPANGAARTISGDVAGPLVDLNGADNVTIDGLNTGSNALTIANTNTGALTTTSTIRFIAGATGNTVTNSSLQGSATMVLATNGGVVFFSTGDNDNNTISNNNIGPAGANLPTKLIYGNGSTTTPNDNITISNNNLFDFFSPTTSVAGVYVNSGNNTWTINNNRIYQTAARTFTSTGLRYSGITLTTTVTPYGAFTVTNNRIGFGAANGTGTTTISGSTNTFRGLDVISVDTVLPTSIQGNTISGIDQTSTSTGTGTGGPFVGMMLGTTRGLINVGDVAGNTIGSLDGSTTIVLNINGTSGGSSLGMYNFSVSNVNISNNQMGAITIQGTGTTAGFTGIWANTGAAVTSTMSNNTVGGPTTAGAITSLHNGATAGLFGVRSSLSNAVMIGNTVQNLVGNSSGLNSISASGIFVTTTAAIPSTIRSNTVHSLTNNAGAVNNNSIYAIYASFGTNVGNVVERNRVHSLNTIATNQTSQIAGILAVAGNATYANNMVRIGHDTTGAALTGGTVQYGIFEVAGSNGFYHNSVYLGGSAASTSSNTFAFVSNVATGTRAYQNNIFWNANSTVSGTGKNYAIAVGGTGLTSNYNDLLATGTAGFTGSSGGDQLTLGDWQTASGQDANSFAANPQFIAPMGSAATGNLHINPAISTPIEATGTPIASVTDDYDGEVRSGLTPTDVGADAGNFIP